MNALFTPASTIGDHRRQHCSGHPRKIDTDPELRALIRARAGQMTFPELADAVAGTFSPDRRIGKSAIHAWRKCERST